jgi:hypothetical protein
VTQDEFLNTYEGCGYDTACNYVPKQAAERARTGYHRGPRLYTDADSNVSEVLP